MVSIEFDPNANALYIRLKKGKVKTSEPLADNIIVDLDENNEILGIEILLPTKSEISKRLAKV
jgi:uncharacterized protein YuzE